MNLPIQYEEQHRSDIREDHPVFIESYVLCPRNLSKKWTQRKFLNISEVK